VRLSSGVARSLTRLRTYFLVAHALPIKTATAMLTAVIALSFIGASITVDVEAKASAGARDDDVCCNFYS